MPRARRHTAAILGLAGLLAGGAMAEVPAVPDRPDAPGTAPGYAPLGYPVPAPGSYRLPPLFEAVDAGVVDRDGRTLSLHALMGDRLVVLSFVYTSCNDVNGCPLAVHVMRQAAGRIAAIDGLGRQVRFITVSFDPARDTPQRLSEFAAGLGLPGGSAAPDWRFLALSPSTELDPLLDAYGQTLVSEPAAAGGGFSHLLRVYLIDRARRVRNVYGVSFLHADTLVNDLQTLLLPAAVTVAGADRPGRRPEPGEQPRPVDLAELLRRPPLGLPPVPPGASGLPGRAAIALGRKLFLDRRLSHNGTLSCAMCHVPEQGFTSNELATAVGIEGRSVRRNSPTLYNVAYATSLFHDGREENLEQQVWGPLLAANEMGNPSVGHVLRTIRDLDDYDGLFEAAFDGRGVGMETLGSALAAYQRALLSADSPFDRWFYGGQSAAMEPAAARGFELFRGKAGCSACHTIGERWALFTDNRLHHTGVGYRTAMGPVERAQRVQLAPGTFVDVDREIIRRVSAPATADVGRYEVTLDPDDRWKYRTPSLRNVALTAPYMHDGSLASLAEVVAFYNAGGVPNPLLDPAIRPLDLSGEEQAALVAFLRALTGSNVAALVADARAAAIGDPGRPAASP